MYYVKGMAKFIILNFGTGIFSVRDFVIENSVWGRAAFFGLIEFGGTLYIEGFVSAYRYVT